MATIVLLPQLGQTMEEGVIVEWLVAEGAAVNRGDVLFTVESDKAVLEVEARAKGVLLKVLVPAGTKVPVQTPVGIIGQEGEDISAQVAGGAPAAVPSAVGAAAPTAAATPAAPTPVEAEPAAPAAVAGPPTPVAETHEGGRIFSSPRARKLAAEEGVDLASVAGSGPEGRIVEKDVQASIDGQPAATPLARKLARELGVALAGVKPAGARIVEDDVRAAAATPVAAAAAPATPVAVSAPAGKWEAYTVAVPLPAAQGELTPLSRVRQITAERMSASVHATASFTVMSEVDATALVAIRTQLKDALAKELGFSVGYNDLLAKIAARCLVEYPYMNVRLEPNGIRHLDHVNVGLAVDTDRGLVVPVLRDADKMSLKELATTFRELVDKGRNGRLSPDDMTGGTFTITNLGMFGIDQFTPIINLPECAILGVGRIKEVPAVVNGQVVVRSKMWVSLTLDHRLVDGGPAARFVQAICKYIEQPYLLLA